jgi:putative hemolysin
MFGHIPVTGEKIAWHGLGFEIVDRDGARIDKVLITPVAASEEPGDESG